eukprot:TRINITY_DN9912_c0_g1_i1.p1 TRINITY_DN9912_c0_g1~~TRINITY_DN9912_c0_g1_i1.p1  ORF type:complete len:525 (+),score=114.76 TRINITY_DN9912_c0_g1_i1:44-1618(+)
MLRRAFSPFCNMSISLISSNAVKRSLQRSTFSSSPSFDPFSSIASILRHREENCGQTQKNKSIVVRGWVKSVRVQKQYAFVTLNDGSSLDGIQIVLPSASIADQQINVGASVEVNGLLQESHGTRQKYELSADKIVVIGASDEHYPLQKKRHTLEYLREISHLRARSNTIGAMLRIRNATSFAIHNFFQGRGFVQIHAPILTASDCEGAGEMFEVKDPPVHEGNETSRKFFGTTARLSVSAQLQAEIFAQALSKVYTFNPIFRAEASHTARHLAEFWMIEPEIAHASVDQLMDLAEQLTKHTIHAVKNACADDISFCNQHIDPTLENRLSTISNPSLPFVRITYTEAVSILQSAQGKSDPTSTSEEVKESKTSKNLCAQNTPFQHPIAWGAALQTEHERYLVDKHFKGIPVFVSHYPAAVKPFYMAASGTDAKTVACFDLLIPNIGELVGGSEREWNRDRLRDRMVDLRMDLSQLDWYLQLREWGSVPHGGFGLGFERLIMLLTGLSNIRDVIPIPRFYGSCRF